MTRRSIYRMFFLSTLMAGMTGCDTLHSWLRHDDDKAAKADSDDISKPKAIESDTSKINAVDSDASNPKPFFKSDRVSGGWSSEAREIEKNLGVN